MRSRLRTHSPRALAALCLALLASCKEASVSIYDVPKDEPDGILAADAMAPTTASGGAVAWVAPDHWQTLAPNAFRKGNYLHVSESGQRVEITVSSFPGDVGGLLANVNRWLGQAGMDPISQAELADLVQPGSVNGVPLTTVDLRPENPSPGSDRIYASIVEHGGETWFFKMTGPYDAVQSQIVPFDQMVAEVRFADGSASASGDTASSSAARGPVAPAPEREILFDPPVGWVESSGSELRVASYAISKEGLPPADFAITTFPGDTGGLVANVNRWRRQIGLGPWSADQVAKNQETLRNDQGLAFQVFDLKTRPGAGPEQDTDRILVAILERGGHSWFFKLRGDALLLETQRSKFRALLQSVRFVQDSPAEQ